MAPSNTSIPLFFHLFSFLGNAIPVRKMTTNSSRMAGCSTLHALCLRDGADANTGPGKTRSDCRRRHDESRPVLARFFPNFGVRGEIEYKAPGGDAEP